MQRLDVLNATTPLCNDVIDNRTRMHATWNVLYAPRLFLLQTFKTTACQIGHLYVLCIR